MKGPACLAVFSLVIQELGAFEEEGFWSGLDDGAQAVVVL